MHSIFYSDWLYSHSRPKTCRDTRHLDRHDGSHLLAHLARFFGIYRATNYLKKFEKKTSLKPNINTQYIIYNHSIPHRVIFPIQTASFALLFSPFFIINYKYHNTNVNLFIFLPVFIAYMIIALFLYHHIIKYSKNFFRKKFKDHAEAWTNEEGIVFKEFGLLPWRKHNEVHSEELSGKRLHSGAWKQPSRKFQTV